MLIFLKVKRRRREPIIYCDPIHTRPHFYIEQPPYTQTATYFLYTFLIHLCANLRLCNIYTKYKHRVIPEAKWVFSLYHDGYLLDEAMFKSEGEVRASSVFTPFSVFRSACGKKWKKFTNINILCQGVRRHRGTLCKDNNPPKYEKNIFYSFKHLSISHRARIIIYYYCIYLVKVNLSGLSASHQCNIGLILLWMQLPACLCWIRDIKRSSTLFILEYVFVLRPSTQITKLPSTLCTMCIVSNNRIILIYANSITSVLLMVVFIGNRRLNYVWVCSEFSRRLICFWMSVGTTL